MYEEIPRGVEVLVKKAAVDPAFKKMLVEKRAKAADDIALKLSPAEAAMLDAVPAALGAATYAKEPAESEMRTTGVDAETPPKAETAEDIILPADTGIIEGIVYDQNRDPISGTTVKIVHTKYEAITGSAGKFRFIAVPVGKYEIKASRVGFSSAKRINIEVREGAITTATFMLQSMPVGGIYHDRP
jgi:hypothetical protein